MHRFISLKNFQASHGGILGGPIDVQYFRTCTLCNRINPCPPFTGRVPLSRLQSTSVKPERIIKQSKHKMYRIGPVHRSDFLKFKRKTKITMLEASVQAEAPTDSRSYITSSPSSPAFASSRFTDVGVSIMLPANSSSRVIGNLSPTYRKSLIKDAPSVTALKNTAADLMLSGMIRNRSPYSPGKSIKVSREENVVLPPLPFSDLLQNPNPFKEEVAEEYKNFEKSQHGEVPAIEVSEKVSIADGKKVTLKEKRSRRKEGAHVKEGTNNVNNVESNDLRINSIKSKKIYRRAAFIDVLLNSGQTDYAYQYAVRGLRSIDGGPSRGVILEPLFVHALHIGKIIMVLSLLNVSRTCNAPLTMESYIKCFEKLGVLPQTETNVNITKSIYDHMISEGVSVDQLLKYCESRRIITKRVLQALNVVGVEYPSVDENAFNYSVDILSPLSDVDQKKSSYYNSPVKGLLTEESCDRLVDEQLEIYDSTIVKVKNIACQLPDSEIEELLRAQNETETEWRKTIEEGFKRDLKLVKDDKGSFQLPLYLDCIPIEKFVDIIIEEVHLRLDDSDGQSIGFIAAERALGKRVKQLYDIQVLRKYGIEEDAVKAHKNYCKWHLHPELHPSGPSNPREIWEAVSHKLDYDDSAFSSLLREWTSETYQKVGKFLYGILLKDVKFNQNIKDPEKPPHMVPALYVVFRKTTKGFQKQLKMHPAVYNIFPTRLQPYISMNVYELPMVCPPRPWVSPSSGIYTFSSPPFQRAPETQDGEEALKENIRSVPTRQLHPCLDSLNQLSSIPWKINGPMLDVVIEVFNHGGDSELDIPAPPSAALPEPPLPSEAPLAERMKANKERALIRQANAATYSLWCDTLYKLCIANEFRDKLFWLPHNMDFRGRVYPVCPHLQHMSNDMARSLLTFARGEKLGPDGLDWLKLHTINLIGHMSKESLSARLEYANEVLPKILDSADKPLTGEKWWVNSDYPWQTLAACKEIAAAIASGDPENYISHFPVHQDGSCNGLQHYAALGRDSLGAQSVNLVDTEKPSDVYMCVCNSVEEQRKKDAAKGIEIAQSLEGFVTRKVVKQTVMTTVYGVTIYGAQLQIRGQLKDLDFPKEKVGKGAAYIAQSIFRSLGEIFTSSRNIQDWLTTCADAIAKSKSMPVTWITPLGLPVLQPYFKKHSLRAKVNVTSGVLPSLSSSRLPNSAKHRQAFSPNFIHSLDSCHMMLTSLYCEQAGIPFVSVHDCYWVHPRNVPAMSKICREQFVALHSKPILEDLSSYLQETYLSNESSVADDIAQVEERRIARVFSAVPQKGDFDLSEVLKSKYFFS